MAYHELTIFVKIILFIFNYFIVLDLTRLIKLLKIQLYLLDFSDFDVFHYLI
jgi:hypothetical protein